MPKVPMRYTEEEEEKPKSFSKTDWLNRAKEKVMQEEWGSATMLAVGALKVELVRIGNTQDLMVRICTQKFNNCLKLTRREHVDSLFELMEKIKANENNIADKLEAIKEVLRTGASKKEEEWI